MGLVFLSLNKGWVSKEDYGFAKNELKVFLLGTLFLTVLGIFIERCLVKFCIPLFQERVFFTFPNLENLWVKLFDLTLGLSFVAISEEIVFRGYLVSWFKKRNLHPIVIVLISSLLFGGVHWGRGIGIVLTAFVWSLLPATFILKYRSIYPMIIAHFFTDLIAFGIF